MKKTILVYLTGLSRSGGKERVVANLLCEWSEKYEVIVVVKEDSQFFYKIPSDVRVYSLKTPFLLKMYNLKGKKTTRAFFTLLNTFFSIVLLRKKLKQFCYDYIYVTTPLNAFETFYSMSEPEKKLVVSEHASINAYNKIYSLIKKHIYPKVYCISVPNSSDTNVYCELNYNAIFIPHLFTYKAQKKNSLDTKIVLNVGRLTGDKQQALLLKIWADIQNKNGWKLLIVGDGEEQGHLEKLIKEYKIEKSVQLLPARRDIQSIYKYASLFVFTSRSEGFGMVLIEAMSFGIPCISFDCPSGPKDIIKNGCNGYLIENENIESFKKVLESTIDLPTDRLKVLGDNAFETVLNWNNIEILKKWDEDIFK